MRIINYYRKLLWLGALAFSQIALAHNSLESSDPAEDSILTQKPEQIVLNFSDPTWLNELTVTDESGNDVVVNTDENSVRSTGFAVPLKPDMTDGKYTVNWTVEGDDTHIITGEFSFTLKQEAAAITESTDGNSQ